jgi:DNA repair protein RadC
MSDKTASDAPTPNRLRSLAVSERPQERMERDGVDALSDTELLAMLVRSGTRGQDVLTLCASLLLKAESLDRLAHWKATDFRKIKGIGRIKALQLEAVMHVVKRVRLREQDADPLPLLDLPSRIFNHLQPHTHGLAVENFWVLCLNRKNRLLKLVKLTIGTASSALAHPREVFREAMRESASAVICAHNHPSGDPSPSSADLAITRQLRDAAKTVDIDLHDHIIMGTRAADPAGLGYYSFRTAGLL